MNSEWLYALFGGGLIGISVSLMLYLNGRVTGISGIIYGLLKPSKGEIAWRIYFLGGLLLGGVTLEFLHPSAFITSLQTANWKVTLAGLLVGFGTVLGSGCTSGHGVCGISRLSLRSIVATLLFVAAGILSVGILKGLGVLS